jgi:NADPH-dependent 2,4-dienoyl-CoA reductase/sulfur reductase-like enzyme
MYRVNHKLSSATPGLPGAEPTLSFWSNPPAPVGTHRSSLPAHADAVIIGSGITGTSVARELLRSGQHQVIVMLEARNACDGATGR